METNAVISASSEVLMQVHEHASELGRWRMAQRRAHPALGAFVRGYLACSSVLPKPVGERHLPSTEIPLVLNFGAPHRRLEAADRQNWIDRDGAWIVGLQDGHQHSEAQGERDFLIVRFTPLGAHCFLRLPMHLLHGLSVELGALDPKLTALVMGRVGAAKTVSARFDAMEALIATRVAEAKMPGGVGFAWHRLEAAGGRIPPARLASEIGCSHRALIARFRTAIGVTPKEMARLFRFHRAMRTLRSLGGHAEYGSRPYIEAAHYDRPSAKTVRWAELAADCGYFDQPHFIREFRRFAGATPMQFVRETVDIV